jgi:hypothetical protein
MSDYNNPSAQSERITAISDYFQPKKPAWNLPKISWGDNTRLPGPQTQQLSKDFNQASEFIATLRSEGPQAAYAKYGAGDINALFDAAAGYGLIDPGERESIWAAFNAPAQAGTGTASNTTSILPMTPRAAAPAAATGEITEEMAMRSGGWINALENQWAAGNRIEPKPGYFKTNAQYREYYQKWRDLH